MLAIGAWPVFSFIFLLDNFITFSDPWLYIGRGV